MDDDLERGHFVIERDDNKILLFEVKFFNAFHFFQDSPYPAFRPSGGAPGDVQLNHPFSRHGHIQGSRKKNQNKKQTRYLFHDPPLYFFVDIITPIHGGMQPQFIIDRHIQICDRNLQFRNKHDKGL